MRKSRFAAWLFTRACLIETNTIMRPRTRSRNLPRNAAVGFFDVSRHLLRRLKRGPEKMHMPNGTPALGHQSHA